MDVRKWVLVIIVLGVIIKLAFTLGGHREKRRCKKVKIGTLKRAKISLNVISPYEVSSDRSLDFTIPKGTEVVFFANKTHYTKKDTILKLNDEGLKMELKRATLEYEKAESNFSRSKALYSNNLISKERYKEDSIELELKRINLINVENRLKNLVFIAPFNGYVDLNENSIYSGKRFYRSVEIKFLSDKIKVKAYVVDFQFLPIAKILELQDTVFLHIITPKEMGFYAKPFITGISKKIEDKNYYEVVFYPYGNTPLRDGLSGELSFKVESKKPLYAISQNALSGIDTPYVYIVKHHMAIKNPVKIGFVGDSLVEVKNLRGDTIITGPLDLIMNLRDSMYVCY